MATLPQRVPGPAPQSGANNGRGKKFVFILVLLLVMAGGGTATYLHFLNRVSSDDANVDGHITAVAPKISGNVAEVLVLDNQQVKAGQVLVRIDPRDFQAKVDQAKAALLQAESQSHSAHLQVPYTNETTQSGATAAEAQLADAEAELARARISLDEASSSDLAYAEANVRSRQASNDRAQADL